MRLDLERVRHQLHATSAHPVAQSCLSHAQRQSTRSDPIANIGVDNIEVMARHEPSPLTRGCIVEYYTEAQRRMPSK